MNNYYTDRCNKLEKSALKRRIYYGVSESSVKLIKKNSKLNESYSGNVLIKNTKEKDTKHPFICAGSANKSYHIGINMQTAMSIVKVSTVIIS
ncbi:Hypothetical protein CINCED_3A011163 [Cinara cedri]|uniref:Uncharacterized protein n=1 Tax=Cinara cedri TaxID=506608 RepID=A0A5E4MSC7_9HEMI|nr:Hypothetical protein CINCED_3A011163 [Cinara cedri]